MLSKMVDWSLLHYRKGLIFTAMLLVFVLGILFSTYMKTGDFVERGIDFKGGTEIVVPITPGIAVDLQKIQATASKAVSGDITLKETKGSATMLIFQSDASITKENIIRVLDSEGVSYDSGGISSQAVGASLGTAFWSQAKMAIVAAFLVMAGVVFYVFKNPIPAAAVVAAGLSDFLFAAAMMDVVGLKLSLATLAALLITLGYSVDTDILLTTRVLKRHDEQSVDERIKSSMKTGMTMTVCAIAAMAVLYFVSTSVVLSEIALVILFGLVADIPFTWVQNVGILKLYLEKRK
ncbi:MAG: protein translocase subunit SecF [Nanoarchaeota archaeon]|nr:protein translocase subunit SecF [Nanoarchaeota archaeon]MBU4451889.1 protein translocase subunit SecF [Nanoarchaeota archaeon]MCG2724172.1 protein translocase subunit SecF [archaeon]